MSPSARRVLKRHPYCYLLCMPKHLDCMHLHLDLMGGLAGDMFIAGMLDACPEHTAKVIDTIAMVGAAMAPSNAGTCRLIGFDDGLFAGARFEVDVPMRAVDAVELRSAASVDVHEHEHFHAHRHVQTPDTRKPVAIGGSHHVPWRDIKRRLESTLDAGVLHHALGIFGVLAAAEAEVHGVAVDDVQFHEVGAWDSVADIVGAACLIDLFGASQWTCSAVPLGGGRIRTAHGPMPVPPPATTLLLRGFTMLDDGVTGERVTPTGAAILKHLMPYGSPPAGSAVARVLSRSGTGFGTRRLPGISNCVRVLVFDPQQTEAVPTTPSCHRQLGVIEFEVDDQSSEELAMGLDRLRRHQDIFDVVQAPVFGKKGRMMSSIRLLVRPSAIEDAITACFRETTTIGLRHHTVQGAALVRRAEEVVVDGRRIRVKSVDRPGGVTAKAESDDALADQSQHARRQLRHEAERLLLQRLNQAGEA